MKKYILLSLILCIAAFFRFWMLGNIPPSPSLDEQSIGWNAYAVLHTGKDEYSQFPLISQRGYDDWRRSSYLFLTIPTIAVFGLNAFAERLPAAVFSLLTVFSLFWIVSFLFKKQTKFSFTASLVVSFLLSISAWHVYISRIGHESNACLSFLVFGILLFLLGEKKKNFALLITSFASFTLSMISYYSGQVVIPILLFAIVLLYWRNLLPILLLSKKRVFIFILSVLIFSVIFATVFSPNSLVRFQGTSTFTTSAHPDLFSSMLVQHTAAVKEKNIFGEVIYNRRWYPVVVFVQGYFSHFDPQWLFYNRRNNGQFKIPNMGLFYLWEIPFILLGVWFILFTKELDKKVKIFIFLWFFLGPLPAAIATQAPHATRAYNSLPVWEIFTGFGLTYLFYKFKDMKIVSIILFGIIVLYSITTLYKNYFEVFPILQSEPYQYAMKNAMNYLSQNGKKYKQIIVSNQDNLFQSYMFYLFYTKYDPKKYQIAGGTVSGGFAQTHKIDNIIFRPILWNNEKPGMILVDNPEDIPTHAKTLFRSYYLDGRLGVVIIKR